MPRRKESKVGNAPETTPPPPPPSDDRPAVSPAAGLPPPGEDRTSFVPLWYPGPAGVIRAVLLNDWAFGWSSHWYQGVTVPHVVEPPDTCEGCKAGQLPRWSAYVYALADPTLRRMILQISSEAWVGCPELRAAQGNLRGSIVTLRRMGTSRQGRVIAQVVLAKPVEGLPPPRDVRPLLSRLWGFKHDWLEWQCGPAARGMNGPFQGGNNA